MHVFHLPLLPLVLVLLLHTSPAVSSASPPPTSLPSSATNDTRNQSEAMKSEIHLGKLPGKNASGENTVGIETKMDGIVDINPKKEIIAGIVVKKEKSMEIYPKIVEIDPSKEKIVRIEKEEKNDETKPIIPLKTEAKAAISPKIVELVTPDEIKRDVLPPKDPQPQTEPINVVVASASGFNYASLDAGAVVLAHTKDAQGAGNILMSDPDKYLLSPCLSPLFFVVGLSEEILVTVVEVVNSERYSSSVKTFELHGAHKYPNADDWQYLGEFTRPTSRGVDKFVLPTPSWARFIKFTKVNAFPNEMYCSISKFRVFGQTTLETLRDDLAASQQQVEAVKTTLSDYQHNVNQAASANEMDLDGTAASISHSSDSDSSSTSLDSTLPIKTSDLASSSLQQQATIADEEISRPPSPTVTPPPTAIIPEATIEMPVTLMGAKYPNPPAADNNIFKMINAKMKDLEIDSSVLKACVVSNNVKVETVLQMLRDELRDVQREIRVSESNVDRIAELENQLDKLTKRNALCETILAGLIVLVMILFLRQ